MIFFFFFCSFSEAIKRTDSYFSFVFFLFSKPSLAKFLVLKSKKILLRPRKGRFEVLE